MQPIKWNQVVCGDAAYELTKIENDSVQAVITSPPYFQQREYEGIGLGNEETVKEYLDNLMKIFNECIRVINDSGLLVFNIGDKYLKGSLQLIPYQFAIRVQQEHPNLKLVNELTWVKTNPTPKQDPKKLIPATEPFFIFAKSDNYVFNRDDFLVSKDKKLTPKPKSNVGRNYFNLIENSDLSPTQKANAVKALEKTRQEIKDGKISGMRMKIKGIHAAAYGGQPGGRQTQLENNGYTIIKLHGKSMKKDVIQHAVASIKGNKHTAIFPQPIIEEIIKLVSNENDKIIDPFMGSGTTALAAINTNRQYYGIEISEEYCNLAVKSVSLHLGSILQEIKR